MTTVQQIYEEMQRIAPLALAESWDNPGLLVDCGGKVSRVLVTLETEDPAEAESWLPGGVLHTDLLVLLRVYLGYRSDARLRLTVPVRLLPEPRLGKGRRIQLDRTGLLGLKEGKLSNDRETLTVSLGRYEGLQCSAFSPAEDGHYRFD